MTRRTYGQLPLRMWQLEGRKIAKADPEGKYTTMLLYMFLRSSPASNAIGLYCTGIPAIADESMLSEDDVKRGLSTLESLDLAFYDAESRTVWVPAVTDELVPKSGKLSAGSNMLEPIRNMLEEMHRLGTPFFEPFVCRYAAAFHLEELRAVLDGEVRTDERERGRETDGPTEPPEGLREGIAMPSEGHREGSGVGSGAGPGPGFGVGSARATPEPPASEPDGWLECRPGPGHPEGRRFAVYRSQIHEWEQSYPGLNVGGLVRDLIQWSLDKKRENPNQLPQHRNAERFFANAFSRHESQGGNRVQVIRLQRTTRRSF